MKSLSSHHKNGRRNRRRGKRDEDGDPGAPIVNLTEDPLEVIAKDQIEEVDTIMEDISEEILDLQVTKKDYMLSFVMKCQGVKSANQS